MAGEFMADLPARPVLLLADDDEAITSNLAPFLERAGFTVHIAPDGPAALELAEPVIFGWTASPGGPGSMTPS